MWDFQDTSIKSFWYDKENIKRAFDGTKSIYDVFTFNADDLKQTPTTGDLFGPIGSPLRSPTTPSTIISKQSTVWMSGDEQGECFVEKKDEEVLLKTINFLNEKNSIVEKNTSTINNYVENNNNNNFLVTQLKYKDFTSSKDGSSSKINENNQTLSIFNRLHVSNIPFRFRREHLYNIFSVFGDIVDTEIIFNQRGSKGFGFVSFADCNSAYKAKVTLHNVVIDGRKIDVNYATPKPRKITWPLTRTVHIIKNQQQNYFQKQQLNHVNKFCSQQQTSNKYTKKFNQTNINRF